MDKSVNTNVILMLIYALFALKFQNILKKDIFFKNISISIYLLLVSINYYVYDNTLDPISREPNLIRNINYTIIFCSLNYVVIYAFLKYITMREFPSRSAFFAFLTTQIIGMLLADKILGIFSLVIIIISVLGGLFLFKDLESD